MEEIHIQCPYCLQAISILLDTGIYESTTIVEDCEVCCRPIEITYIVEDKEIKTYSYNSIEGNEF
ncbi:MAG: CPXCG motif-containing cysteine-rich protein [Arcobacter sp.]|uniref:CPXCG motif-containing cysteine-rich protein n=1 Tax=Arcobacter sp. TaxID=1872629 RepID=UPI003D067AA7